MKRCNLKRRGTKVLEKGNTKGQEGLTRSQERLMDTRSHGRRDTKATCREAKGKGKLVGGKGEGWDEEENIRTSRRMRGKRELEKT